VEDHPRRSDGRRHCRLDRDTLDQLLGYLPLDYQDEYAVDTLALYSARYAYLVTWPVIELLTELAGGPVDLAELRIGFQEAARRSASTKSLSNRDRRPPGRSNGDAQGDKLHAWLAETPEENRAEVDQMTAAKAFIMGRNMFGPVRGEWDRQWNGWWGDDPPFHAPVFVLTHYPRDPQPMNGGTTFHFVTDGIESALRQAREAAGDGDVSIQGGRPPSTSTLPPA
jgi:dihydrofolate reductase